MADRYSVSTSAFTLTSSSTETIIQLATGSTARAAVWGWTFSLDADTTATDTMILCEALRQTTVGTGGASGSQVPFDPNAPTSLVTSIIGQTGGGTAGDIIDGQYAHPNGGFWTVQLSVPVIVEVSSWFGLRTTTPAAVAPDAAVSVIYEV